jgi:hypothetical protein
MSTDLTKRLFIKHVFVIVTVLIVYIVGVPLGFDCISVKLSTIETKYENCYNMYSDKSK